MAEHETERTIIERLEKIEEHARKLVEAGKRNDWREAELQLRHLQTSALNATRFIEMANDIQRGQIR